MRAAGQRLPERRGADAENQQERGAGAPLADQPGFPALPAVLLQVLPVAEGERRKRAARGSLERLRGRAGSPGRCPVAGLQSGLGSQPGIRVTVSDRAIRFLPQGMMPPPAASAAAFHPQLSLLGGFYRLPSRSEPCLRALPKGGSICWAQVF